MPTFRLLHASDLHFADEPGRPAQIVPGKYLSAFWSALSRGHKPWQQPSHNPKVAEALSEQAAKSRGKLDGILLTGDIATTGLENDLLAAKSFLSVGLLCQHPIARRPRIAVPTVPLRDIAPLIIMPGNHDRFEGRLFKSGRTRFELARLFGAHWRERLFAGTTDLGDQATHVHSFHLAKPGIDATLSMCCADFSVKPEDSSVRTLGNGVVYNDTLDALTELTRKCRKRFSGTSVVWAVHFPPEFSDVASCLELRGGSQLIAAADSANVPVIFSGHTHDSRDYSIPAAVSNIRIICCGTTLEHQRTPPLYHNMLQLVELVVEQGGVDSVTVRRLFYRVNADGLGEFS